MMTYVSYAGRRFALPLAVPAWLAVVGWLAAAAGELPEQGDKHFELPFPAGKSHLCLKAPGTEDAISGEDARDAIDFALSENSAVVASAAGRVVLVREDSKLSGEQDIYEPHANQVVIDHGEGLFTRYLHLATDAVDVEEGDYVKAGQKLAESGSTGRTDVPKLRFALTDVWGRALPVRFADLKEGVPVEKKPALSKNEDDTKAAPPKKPTSKFSSVTKEKKPAEEELPPPPPATSTLPLDAFEFNGVTLTCTLPANLYEDDWTYVITGRVANEATRVTLFLSKRDLAAEGTVAFFIAPVTAERTFALPVRLLDQADKIATGGPFRYAITTVPTDGNFASPKMLPLVITKKQ
jgi:hypothetical protein